MLGFRFIKVQPTTYLIEYRNGKIKKEGTGLSFFYYTPITSLAAIPIGTTDTPFMIKETTSDHQPVTLQGQIVYKITEPKLISEMLNYTLDINGKDYISEDPEKLNDRIITQVQVLIKNALQKMTLNEALTASDKLTKTTMTELKELESIKSLGIKILELSILAIKPVPETARALEAKTREELLKEADSAIYDRRNAAVEQERTIKENELNTELLIQEKEQNMRMAEVNGKIDLEEENKKLANLTAENAKIVADAKAYDLSVTLEPLTTLDPKLLQVLANNQMNSNQIIAQAFRDISENADKIGQLNISPDLLNALLDNKDRSHV